MLGRTASICLLAIALILPEQARAQPKPAEPAMQQPVAPLVLQPTAPQSEAPGARPASEESPAPPPSPPATPVTTPPPPPAAPDETSPEFIRMVQFELVRVGCGVLAPDGTWNAATRRAVEQFNEHGRWRFDPARPSRGLLAALQRNEARVCPPNCEPGTELRGMSCVAVRQPPPAPQRQAAPSPQRQAAPSARPPSRQATPPRREQSPRREAQPQRRQAQPARRQAQPAQRQAPAPAECWIDLGYGRRAPCDAGGGR